MKTTKLLVKCALLAAAIAGLQPVSAKVLYVGTGDQWSEKPAEDKYATPNAAFTAASAGDEIWIAEGEYVATRFALTNKLASFYGGFVGTENSTEEREKVPSGKGWEFTHPTTLKQTAAISNGMFSALNPASGVGDVSIDGLILDGDESVEYNNCGIYWNAGTALSINVSIKNCIVQNFGKADSTNGGGIYLAGTQAYTSFIIDACLIQNNKGNNGGGVRFEGNKILQNCEIRNNVASHASPTEPTNTSTQAGNGGGIFFQQGASGYNGKIYSCLVEGNMAYSGGGVFLRNAQNSNIHGCIVVNNTANHGGGVAFSAVSTGTNAKLANFTIASNRATEHGAGVYFANTTQRVYNTIFWNNINTGTEEVENVYLPSALDPTFSHNIIDKAYANLTQTNCVVSSDSAAIFGSNWVTANTSPGVNMGADVLAGGITLPATDYTGKARQIGVIDIGPYEAFPAPSNLTGTSGGNVVVLMWEAVSDADSYRVYADADSVSEATTLVATVSTLYHRVTGLTPESKYTFTVKAAGDPAAAATVRVTTLGANVPEAPDGLTLTQVTDTSASLSWTLPTDVGNISKYIIYANDVAVDSTADATGVSCVVQGLLPWRSYLFTVRSKSSATGVLSAPTTPLSVHTTDNIAPSAPSVTLKSAGRSSLTIEWSASDEAGILAGYTIYVNSSVVGSIVLSDIDADVLRLMDGKFSWTIGGRAANTRYSVAVEAYDEAGNSSELIADSLSTNNDEEPSILYVGKWIGKPADRIRTAVNAAYTEIAGVPGAQLWIQGEHTLTAAIDLSGNSVDGFSLYGGFAGYENSPDERVRVAGGKGWEFACPTKLIRATGRAIYSSATNAPLGNVTIDGLTLEGANSGTSQGIYWSINPATGSIAIRSCVIQNFGGDASTYDGGGIQLGGDARHEPFVVEDCLIRNNRAKNGGGISMDGYRVVRRCEIRNNSVAQREGSAAPEDGGNPTGAGGGIYVYGARGTTSLTDCLIEGNSAYSGGGLFLRYVADSAAVSNNVVANNTAAYGGGVAFSGDTNTVTAARISGFTIAANRATAQGGGLYFADSSQQVYNTILWNNLTADESAEKKVENVYAAPLAGDLTLSHSIADRDYSTGSLAQVSCVTETDSARLFGAGWVTLYPSAAEDAGVRIASILATSAPATDMAGRPRVVGGGIDIGPYERQAESGAPSVPQNLEGTPEGASDILLTWRPSTPDGSDAVAGYLIYLNRTPADTVLAPDTSYTATGLIPGDYTIQVAAFSATGKTSPKTPLDNVVTLMEGGSYIVRISAGDGITITSPEEQRKTVPAGDSLEITFTVAEAYERPIVLANGNAVSCAATGAGYVAVIKSAINVNVSLSASLKPTVTISADQQSITVISPSGISFAVHTDSVLAIRFNLKQGYANPVVTVNGDSVEVAFSGGVYNATVTVTENVTIALSAVPAPVTGIEDVWDNDYVVSTIYYSLLGQEVREPAISGIYVVKEIYASKKSVVRKRLIIVK